jgi:hypothetical protein
MAATSKEVRRMLGLSLHGWENFMVVSLIIAGFFALIAGVTTWAVISLQRIEIAESNARQKEAELKLEQLRKLSGPRDINFDTFQKELQGKPKAPVVIWYLPDSSDGYWFASRLFAALNTAKGEVAFPTTIPDIDEKTVEEVIREVAIDSIWHSPRRDRLGPKMKVFTALYARA